jgi:hypothetical protein
VLEEVAFPPGHAEMLARGSVDRSDASVRF